MSKALAKVATKRSTKLAPELATKQSPNRRQPINDGKAWAAQGIRMVLAQFTDINGTAKGKLVQIGRAHV